MKKVSAAAVSIALVAGVLIGLNGHRFHFPLDAQEAPQPGKTNPKSGSVDTADQRILTLGDATSPAFFVDDVVEMLTNATETLMEQKQTRNSEDLRKDLDRTEASIRLPLASTKQLSPQDLYRRAAESVFLVAGLTRPTEEEADWQTAFSTAFAVHEDGILSTSAHVFDHDDQDDAVVVMDIRGQVYPVLEILAINRQADTCLFRVATKKLKPLPLGQTAFPGAPIHVIGHPGDSFFFFSAGHIANYERDPDGAIWLNVTADFGQGSSGGPVMDSAGNIVGQVSRTYTLYAGGEASARKGRPVRVRQVDKTKAEDETTADSPDDESAVRKRPDPQMVFKSCTPVSAIRELVK